MDNSSNIAADHIGLVKKVLKSMYIGDSHQNYLDYLQAGYIGILKAKETYDSSKGCQFQTHAYWLIRKEIQMAYAYNADSAISFANMQAYQDHGQRNHTHSLNYLMIVDDESDGMELQDMLPSKEDSITQKETVSLEEQFVKDLGGDDVDLIRIVFDASQQPPEHIQLISDFAVKHYPHIKHSSKYNKDYVRKQFRYKALKLIKSNPKYQELFANRKQVNLMSQYQLPSD